MNRKKSTVGARLSAWGESRPLGLVPAHPLELVGRHLRRDWFELRRSLRVTKNHRVCPATAPCWPSARPISPEPRAAIRIRLTPSSSHRRGSRRPRCRPPYPRRCGFRGAAGRAPPRRYRTTRVGSSCGGAGRPARGRRRGHPAIPGTTANLPTPAPTPFGDGCGGSRSRRSRARRPRTARARLTGGRAKARVRS